MFDEDFHTSHDLEERYRRGEHPFTFLGFEGKLTNHSEITDGVVYKCYSVAYEDKSFYYSEIDVDSTKGYEAVSSFSRNSREDQELKNNISSYFGLDCAFFKEDIYEDIKIAENNYLEDHGNLDGFIE